MNHVVPEQGLSDGHHRNEMNHVVPEQGLSDGHQRNEMNHVVPEQGLSDCLEHITQMNHCSGTRTIRWSSQK
jgi:hypothetical protein